MSVLTPPTHVGLRDHLVGAAMAVVYLVILLATANDLALSRDESFYVIAAHDYGSWYGQLFTHPEQALTRQSIDRHWHFNSEHPALMKTVFGLTWLLDERTVPALGKKLGIADAHLFTTPSLAYRFGGMLSAALLLWLWRRRSDHLPWALGVLGRRGVLLSRHAEHIPPVDPRNFALPKVKMPPSRARSQ